MTIFKTKSFSRRAIGIGLNDAELNKAAAEVLEGVVEASLGGGVFKKRVALPGRSTYMALTKMRNQTSQRKNSEL